MDLTGTASPITCSVFSGEPSPHPVKTISEKLIQKVSDVFAHSVLDGDIETSKTPPKFLIELA